MFYLQLDLVKKNKMVFSKIENVIEKSYFFQQFPLTRVVSHGICHVYKKEKGPLKMK